MDAAEVAIHECVTALGLVGRTLRKAEMPFGVVVPGVGFQERVLILRSRLDLTPIAVENVLAGFDETASVRNCPPIDRIRGHEVSMRKPQKTDGASVVYRENEPSELPWLSRLAATDELQGVGSSY